MGGPKTIQTIAIPPHYSTELADKTLLKIPYTSVSRYRLMKVELIWKSGSFLLLSVPESVVPSIREIASMILLNVEQPMNYEYQPAR